MVKKAPVLRSGVFIESRDFDHIWTTVGVSEDIIEASWQALADSFQFKLSNLSTLSEHEALNELS